MDIILTTIFILTVIFLVDFFTKPKWSFPIPYRIPLLGHFPFLGNVPHIQLTKWSQTYGKVFAMQILNSKSVVVNDIETFNALVEKGDFSARNRSMRFIMLAAGEKDDKPKDLFACDATPFHQKLKAFTREQICELRKTTFYTDIYGHVSKCLVQNIQKNSVNNVIDPFDVISNEVYHFYYCMNKGELSPSDTSSVVGTTKAATILRYAMSGQGKTLDLFPSLRYFGNPLYRKLQEVNRMMTETFVDIKSYVTENGKNSGLATGFLLKDDKPNLPDEANTVLIVNSLMGAGEPVVTTTYGMCLILAAFPHVQDKIREEIAAKVGKNITDPAKLYKYTQNLNYMRAFRLEALRYLTPVPMMIRRARQDTTLLGEVIPKDTSVVVNLYAAHHDPQKYEEPWSFKPERFLDDKGALVDIDHPNRKNLKSFGAGKKMCVGVPLAYDLLLMLSSLLVNKFEIKQISGVPIYHDSRTWDQVALALEPKRSKLQFIPRE